MTTKLKTRASMFTFFMIDSFIRSKKKEFSCRSIQCKPTLQKSKARHRKCCPLVGACYKIQNAETNVCLVAYHVGLENGDEQDFPKL